MHANHHRLHDYGCFWRSHEITQYCKDCRVRPAHGAGGQFVLVLPEVGLVPVSTSYWATNMPAQHFGREIVAAPAK